MRLTINSRKKSNNNNNHDDSSSSGIGSSNSNVSENINKSIMQYAPENICIGKNLEIKPAKKKNDKPSTIQKKKKKSNNNVIHPPNNNIVNCFALGFYFLDFKFVVVVE